MHSRNMIRRRSPRFVMALVGLLLVPLFGVLFTSNAAGHEGVETVIYLDIFPDGTAQGQIEHPITLLNEEFGIGLDPQTADEAAIAAIEPLIRSYNTENLSVVSADGTPWELNFTGEVEPIETETQVYAAFRFDVENVFDSAPRVFDVTFDGVFEGGVHFGVVVIRTDPVTGVFLNEGDTVPGFINSGSPTLPTNLDDPNIIRAFTGTVELGAQHIFIGTDHILFVLVLLIPAVMMYSLADGWSPVPSFRSGLFRVLKIATAFTLAHSITLTLGGLEIVTLPSKLVETTIAISIVATAFHNLKPIFANREALIAFIFGIFHGFGFAGLLSDLGVGNGQRVLSLLGFNLGVEIGQAVIILLLFPALFLLRRTRIYVPALRIGSIVLAGVATIWALERIFETTLGIDNVLERFTRTPRVFVLIAIATLLAAGIRQVEAIRGTLAPIEGDSITAETKETVSV